MQDEVLAHRLGLIPLTADPRQFTYPGPEWSPETGTDRDTLEFSLEVRCSKDPDTPGQYVDSHVLTDKLVWVPRGDQASWLTDPGPEQKDILINKLRPGHEMEIKLFAVKVNFIMSAFYSITHSPSGSWPGPRKIFPRGHRLLPADASY